jgi:hypothetical protein
MEQDLLGRRAHAHRQADEGRPRRELHRENADGKTVNRWTTTGMLCASASTNEVGYITHKTMRSLGMLAFDNQARV